MYLAEALGSTEMHGFVLVHRPAASSRTAEDDHSILTSVLRKPLCQPPFTTPDGRVVERRGQQIAPLFVGMGATQNSTHAGGFSPENSEKVCGSEAYFFTSCGSAEARTRKSTASLS